MATMPSPGCGRPCPVQDKFCMTCGARLAPPQGAAPQQPAAPNFGRPRTKRQVEELPAPLLPVQLLLEFFPGLVHPGVIIAAVVALLFAVAIVVLGLWVASLGAVAEGIIIAGFGMVIYWAAVAWLMNGSICMPAEALADLSGMQWLVFAVLAIAPTAGFLFYLHNYT